MIRKIRRQFELIKGKRLHSFDDFDPIIRRCLKEYAYLFPQHRINMAGSKVVYHFNVEEVDPISLEREHGSRDSIPRRYAKFAIAGIEDLLAFVENATVMDPSAEEVESDEGNGDSKHSDEHDPHEGTE
jgi:hypothetical protein